MFQRASWRMRILACALGVGALQWQPHLPGWAWLWPCLPLPALLVMLPRSSSWRQAGLLLLAFLFGFGYAAWRAELRLADALDPHWAGREVDFIARVTGLVDRQGEVDRLAVRIETVLTAGARVPGQARLSLRRPAAERATAGQPTVRGGDCLHLRARLWPPRGLHNPGGFDYEAWMFERGQRASGYILTSEAAPGRCPGRLRASLDGLREHLRERLRGHLADSPQAGVVLALALGDQNAIDPEAWRLFRDTGVMHLMSISGMHVTLLGWLVFLAAAALWRRVPVLAARWPAHAAASWLGLAVSAAYVALAGFGIPAQRTLYMLAAVTVAYSLERTQSASRSLAVALALVLAIDPWAVLSIGFWLSFGVVAALLWADAGRLARQPFWRLWLHAQWVASIALLPALMLAFQSVPLVSPLANAFAIPLISLLAVPLSLAAALLPWAWPAQAAGAVIGSVVSALTWLHGLGQPVWHAAAPGAAAMLLGVLGVVWLLLPAGMPARWLGGVMLLPLLLPRTDLPAAGDFRLDVLDVGQGLAVIVRTRGHNLVYDAGPLYAAADEAGRRVVLPYLLRLGVTRLDGMIVSHDDIDHRGGAATVQAGMMPAWLLSSLVEPGDGRLSAGARALIGGARRSLRCHAGQTWQWDGVRFDILHPPARFHDNPGFPDNDRSCVLRIRSRSGSALLTGDLGRLGEMSLLEAGSQVALAARVLVVGHHGSDSSSSPAMLRAVRPEHALISVGAGNAFGHPHPALLARLAGTGAQVWRTDREGALRVAFTAGHVQVTRTRSERLRYWHAAVREAP